MLDRFNAEMNILNHLAKDFARAYPEQGRMLNIDSLKDRDPNIERLLEGVAFLTSKVKEKIDDDLPEITENLLYQIYPNALEPVPSACIMQFEPNIKKISEPIFVPQGTLIEDDQNGLPCKFITVSNINILPIKISGIWTNKNDKDDLVVSLKFTSFVDIDLQDNLYAKLPIYVQHDRATSLSLLHIFSCHFKSIDLVLADGVKIKNAYTCHIPLKDRKSILPKYHRGFDLYNIWLEYFCFPDQFNFIAFERGKKDLSTKIKEFQIDIHLDEQFDVSLLNADTFLLNCVPAVNRWETMAEPIRMRHHQYEYKLQADNQHESIRIQKTIEVNGLTESGERIKYYSINDFNYMENNNRFYSIHRKCIDDKVDDLYISIGGHDFIQNESLSCKLEVNNGYLPRQLYQEKQFIGDCKCLSDDVQVLNVTRPTNIVYPKQNMHKQWDIIAHLHMNVASLTDISILKKLLLTYDWSFKVENQNKRDALLKSESKTIHEVYHGGLIRILQYNLQLDERKFTNIGDVYLFGCLFHYFLLHYVNIGYFLQTKVICIPSQKEYLWGNSPGIKENI